MAAHDTVESVPTIAWNRCPSSVECAICWASPWNGVRSGSKRVFSNLMAISTSQGKFLPPLGAGGGNLPQEGAGQPYFMRAILHRLEDFGCKTCSDTGAAQ